jgi:hypothetical protein
VVIQVMAVLYLFWLGKLIPGERGWGGKLVRAEAQNTQLQPFSVRFKNIIVTLAGLCCFF